MTWLSNIMFNTCLELADFDGAYDALVTHPDKES